ncbi:hypothetical protein NDU88_001769 [Pleurodeles waltl]|uniref:Uncharacterized protein n=1 Tax=Pleurodeles waltl TaxID=8319 RepID=A0AAV7T0V8_PLEWA|nr:hypothetical protein NDU88_001769 [Pleurodeles waltl]
MERERQKARTGGNMRWRPLSREDSEQASRPSAAGRRWERHHPKDRPVTDRLRRRTQLQVTQEQRVVIQTTASLTESPVSDRDRIYFTDIYEMEDMSDLDSITSVSEELPRVTPQTAEDIF